MGVIADVARAPIAAAGEAVQGVSEVFLPNATRQMELSSEAYQAALAAAAAEFAHAGPSWFDRAINGLNRLPRPLLALGTLWLFAYAMADPIGFALRMRGLAEVPKPLWWLLGANVGFYFGAREMHYLRSPGRALGGALAGLATGARGEGGLAQAPLNDPVAINPTLSAWRAEAGDRDS